MHFVENMERTPENGKKYPKSEKEKIHLVKNNKIDTKNKKKISLLGTIYTLILFYKINI